jgi:2-methylcitrate dehydratase PrpD
MNLPAADIPVTRQLAAFVVGVREPIPKAALRIVGAVADNILAGASSEAAVIALATFNAFGRAGPSSVIGRRIKFDAPSAALINGIAAHAGGAGEGPEVAVSVAGLAAGELVDGTVADLAKAVAIGVEVTGRVARGFSPDVKDRGWHRGVFDALGAAAAASSLLKLNDGQIVCALSAAATQAAGLQVATGTMTRSFDIGKAAANGVEAAMLAMHGFAAPATGIEAPRGLSLLIAAPPRFDEIVAGLGDSWIVESHASFQRMVGRSLPHAERVGDLVGLLESGRTSSASTTEQL